MAVPARRLIVVAVLLAACAGRPAPPPAPMTYLDKCITDGGATEIVPLTSMRVCRITEELYRMRSDETRNAFQDRCKRDGGSTPWVTRCMIDKSWATPDAWNEPAVEIYDWADR
ncbi:MAG: hypothetical protein OXF41_00505 [bacterium]|nr:hypothetical protein [bacterium]